MKKVELFKIVSLFLFAIFFAVPRHAYAYLDLGTGSLVFQMFIATLFVGIYMLKSYFKKIMSFVKTFRRRKD